MYVSPEDPRFVWIGNKMISHCHKSTPFEIFLLCKRKYDFGGSNEILFSTELGPNSSLDIVYAIN